MNMYRLSNAGMMLSHSIRIPSYPPELVARWGVIMYLAKVPSAPRERILMSVPGATSNTLAYLSRKGIIINESEVMV